MKRRRVIIKILFKSMGWGSIEVNAVTFLMFVFFRRIMAQIAPLAPPPGFRLAPPTIVLSDPEQKGPRSDR